MTKIDFSIYVLFGIGSSAALKTPSRRNSLSPFDSAVEKRRANQCMLCMN